MYPDKSALYAFQRIYEPLPTVDNKWIVFYKVGNDWRQKMFITLDGAYMFFYTKVNEYKTEYQKMANQKGR